MQKRGQVNQRETTSRIKAKSGDTIAAGKGYLEFVGSPVKLFLFEGGDATGIEAIDNEQLTNDNKIYNLAGQRLQKIQRGMNIINGKKVLR